MEVIRSSTTTTDRPRFVPTEPVVMPSATATMTRSAISHHNHHHQTQQQQQQQTCNNGQTSTSTSSDTSIRDKTKLLQLAEKVHTRKSVAATPTYTKSFRGAISSVVSKGGGGGCANGNGDEVTFPTPSVRRTNSTMLTTSSAPSAVSRSKVENYKNPKLYASFSSKSSSKLTKALIKADPAKTNIEHLVRRNNVSPPKAVAESGSVSVNGKNKSPPEAGERNGSSAHNGNGGGGGGGGLSSFITPLKALHASFHERSSKLGQTRHKLFSHHHHRDISTSNAKLLFGTTENLHSSSSGSSSEDILAAQEIIYSKTNKSLANGEDQRRRRQLVGKRVPPVPPPRADQYQNGNRESSVPPDFLEGFQNNENQSSASNHNNNNNVQSTNNKLNGVHHDGYSRGGHESQENSNSNHNNNNNNNSFITPDILGGCLDVPSPTARQHRNHIGSRGNEHNKLAGEEQRQVNGTNYHHVHRGTTTTTTTNGQVPYVHHPSHQQQVVQQHFNSNNDISQKRKNIVVRMSYQDETSYNDLYPGVCQHNNQVGDATDDDSQVEEKLIWPTCPITVSTVTPKRAQQLSATPEDDDDDGAVQVGRQTTNKNNYYGEDSTSNDNVPTTTTTSSTLDAAHNNANNISNSFNTANSLNSLNSSYKSANNAKAGGGVAAQTFSSQHLRPSSSSSSSMTISTMPNSSEVLAKSEDKSSLLSLQQFESLVEPHSSSNNSKGRCGILSGADQQPHHLVVRSHSQKQQQPQEHAKCGSASSESHSPEATGSPTWLPIKNYSSLTTGYTNSLPRLKENDSGSNQGVHYSDSGGGGGGGVKFTKHILKRTSTVTATPSAAPYSCLPPLSKVAENGGPSQYYNGVETDDFSVIVTSVGDGEKGIRLQRGVLMEAETSFSAHQHQQESRSRVGSGRPHQTALLSDEYAQFLGYDYGNGAAAGDKVQQQAAQPRLHVLQLGNKCSVIPSKGINGENGHDDHDDGDDDEQDNENAMVGMMIAPTNGHNKYGNLISNGVHHYPHHQNLKHRPVPTLVPKTNSINGIMKPRVQQEKGKRRPEQHRTIAHSVSFRGTDSDGKILDGGSSSQSSATSAATTDDEPSKFDRKRSRSLPKSFLSVRNGLRSVLPSQWTVRDGLAFERLNDHDEVSCPDNIEERVESSEAVKMRWHKLGSSPSSASTVSDKRPKSFDYAQRKAWMKLYHDMEVSQASGNSTPRNSRPLLSKGSITHLHLQEVSSDPCCHLEGGGDGCRCEYDGGGGDAAAVMRSSDISSTSPSLFKRFSKTFSLRFGSGSNVSKNVGDVHRKTKSKSATGSSPDLIGRHDTDGSRDKVNGKMRKSNVKSVRGDKCQSGDSGIGMDEQQAEPRHVSNLRRIRSDYISPSVAGASSSAFSAYASRGGAVNGSTSTLAKLSLVEIPDHSWDEHNGSPNSSDTASYEDLVDAKLDRDDGFSSGDEGQRPEQVDNPTYYHSLPHRKHNKRRLKESESTSGDVPQEDTSIRGKVVREIIHTEQNYVKTLNDIVQGFLNPCRARHDLFSSRTVQNIFSNIEEILRLHVKFLEALKSKVDTSFVSRSNIGEVFTSWADRFSLYSEYCCNNPISVATVRSLVQFPQYAEFFEACRRLQMMDKLPLHGFLLRPIQRICQYHLQLNELLKHTEEPHTDHNSVVRALETMKSVATKINDTQRQFESIQEIIRFQESIDGWEGPRLVDRNAVILYKGELVKVTHGRKQKEVFVAVLNKDLIYCKKDFMKKSGYVFDGRIDLNLRMWINIDSNEEDEFFGMVHNSWRIYSPERRAWILFTAPSPNEKRKWISALEKTKEEISIDPKLRDMAVVTTALAASEMMSNGSSYGHNSNTLPKSSKKTKGKHLSVTKVDSDAMLIEVGKLKRSAVHSNPNPSQKEGSSKFYV